MQIKVITPYYDSEMDRYFLVGEILKVEDKENSDFYHIWQGNKLYLIEKKCCEKV